MKLRIRSIESNETQKIEVPNASSLHQLKQLINQQLLPSSSSAPQHSNLSLSLNKKDELFGDSLHSLGITSGDLVYYSTNLYAISSSNPSLLSTQRKGIDVRSDTQMLESVQLGELGVFSGGNPNLVSTQKEGFLEINAGDDQDVNLRDTRVSECRKLGDCGVSGDAQVNELRKLSNLDDDNTNNCDLVNAESSNSGVSDEFVDSIAKNQGLVHSGDLGHGQMMESENNEEGAPNTQDRELSNPDDEMEVDEESVINNASSRFSVPGFLKKVYVKEVGEATANGGNHKLVVIAVHAVLLESGFVCYDTVSGMKVDGFHLPGLWPSSAFGISLHYTLLEIASSEVVETVVLKFQTLGKYINVFGSLSKKKAGEVHRVTLDEPKLLPALSYIWSKSDSSDESSKSYPSQEIFEFWKIVKDGLSYPLLIELCEKVGLTPPLFFNLLPTDIKLQILETLPAVDIAKVACVSSELNFVASNNDLWKKKYDEEFGNAGSSNSNSAVQWKARFGSVWENRKRANKRARVPLKWGEPPHFRPLFPGRRNPNPLGMPFIIGGDYDRLPVFGLRQEHPGRRVFRTNPHLGGFDA